MDERILLAGVIPLAIVTAGCVLVCCAYSVPPEGIIGLLLMSLPPLLLCWYTLVRVENLASGVKIQGRAIQRAVDDQARDLKRRYDDTMREVLDLNNELTRRIYR